MKSHSQISVTNLAGTIFDRRSEDGRRGIKIVLSMAALLCGYLFSYYGYIRKSEGVHHGKPMYSLNYDRIRGQRLAKIVEQMHWPLQWIE